MKELYAEIVECAALRWGLDEIIDRSAVLETDLGKALEEDSYPMFDGTAAMAKNIE